MSMRIMISSVVVFFTTAIAFSQERPLATRLTPQPYQTGRSVVMAKTGMVATSQALATQIGLDTLRKGGSAVDAAIAADAALGLMEPMSCGIGGDLYAIVWDNKSKKLYGLNASGRSPYKATRDYFKAQSGSWVKSVEELMTSGLMSSTLQVFLSVVANIPNQSESYLTSDDYKNRLAARKTLAAAVTKVMDDNRSDEGFSVDVGRSGQVVLFALMEESPDDLSGFTTVSGNDDGYAAR